MISKLKYLYYLLIGGGVILLVRAFVSGDGSYALPLIVIFMGAAGLYSNQKKNK